MAQNLVFAFSAARVQLVRDVNTLIYCKKQRLFLLEFWKADALQIRSELKSLYEAFDMHIEHKDAAHFDKMTTFVRTLQVGRESLSMVRLKLDFLHKTGS